MDGSGTSVEASHNADNQHSGPQHKGDIFGILDHEPQSALTEATSEMLEQLAPLQLEGSLKLQVDEHSMPVAGPSKSRKRKRKAVAQPEEQCWKCRRSIALNAEDVLSCSTCGRSEHATCTGKNYTWAREWDWLCENCKVCDICDQTSVYQEELLSCRRCDRGWHMSCLQFTGYEEPPDLPTCPKCRGTSVHNSLAPSAVITPLETTAPIQVTNPIIQPSEQSNTSIPPAKLRQQRQRSSVSSIFSTSKPPQTPIDSKPPIKRSKSRPPKLITTSELVVAEPRPKSAKPGQGLPRPRISIRLPPKRKSEGGLLESPKRKAFEEILTFDQAATDRTVIHEVDRGRFEKSKVTAEAKLGVPLVPQPGTPLGVMTPVGPATPKAVSKAPLLPTDGLPGISSRPLKTPLTQAHLLPSTPGPSTPKAFVQAVAAAGPAPLRIRKIRIGQYEVDTWYDAPFPEEYAAVPEGKLYMCEFCLKYSKSPFGAARHRMKCMLLHPPGDEIYRDGSISIFEVDGRHNKIYCQNLCLLSKIFLDHKSLFYDVEPFLFYVMTEVDDAGAHFVGYFSKEKRSPKDFNVSCIMTLPVRQKAGWGNLLIDFSYLLTLKEGRYGTPERPLSKLGALAYGRYWQLQVYRALYDVTPEAASELQMEDICRKTRMTLEDVFNTLRTHGLITLGSPTPQTPNGRPSSPTKTNSVIRHNLTSRNSSPSKPYGSPLPRRNVSVYDLTEVPTEHYTITWNRRVIKEYLDNYDSKGLAKLRPEKLQWSPYLIARARRTDASLVKDGLWDVEVDEYPEPSMHAHTPLEPVERPPIQRANSGQKTPKKRYMGPNGTGPGSGKRNPGRDPSPTASTFTGYEEPQEDDDDEFRDEEDSFEVPNHGLRHRSSNHTRAGRSRGLDDESETEPEETWEAVPTSARRTRSGRMLGSNDAESGSEWGDGSRVRTRSRSHNTKSSKRAPSSSPSLEEQLHPEEESKHPSPRKRSQRVIKSPSESGAEDREDDEGPASKVEAAQMMTAGMQEGVRPFDDEAFLSFHFHAEHGPTNGLTSDDQLPETPRVIVTEEQPPAGPSEGFIQQTIPEAQTNGWHDPTVNHNGYQFPPSMPININVLPQTNGMFSQPNIETYGMPIDWKFYPQATAPVYPMTTAAVYPTSSAQYYSVPSPLTSPSHFTPTTQFLTPLSHKLEPDTQATHHGVASELMAGSDEVVSKEPRATSEDAVVREISLGLGNGWGLDENGMDMCDEDAEGEDDLTYA